MNGGNYYQKAAKTKLLHKGFYSGLDFAFKDGTQKLRDLCRITILERVNYRL